MNCQGRTFDTEENISRARGPAFSTLASLLPLRVARGEGRSGAHGRGHVPRGVGTQRKGEAAASALLPLVLDFLIKIARTVSARKDSTCFHFSQWMETTWRICPFLSPSEMQMEGLIQGLAPVPGARR